MIIRYETETLNQLRYCAVLAVKLRDTQHGVRVSIAGQKKEVDISVARCISSQTNEDILP